VGRHEDNFVCEGCGRRESNRTQANVTIVDSRKLESASR
jgi:hypothetical protein